MGDNTGGRLTIRQEKFINCYIANGGNGYKAAQKAGYTAKDMHACASEIMTNPKIKRRLDDLKNELHKTAEEKTGLTLEFKFTAIMEGIKACLNGDARSDSKVEVKGLAMLIAEANKMQGHYAPEKTVNTNLNSTIDTSVMEELIKKYTKEY